MNEVGVNQLTGVSSHKLDQAEWKQGVKIPSHGDHFTRDATGLHGGNEGGWVVPRVR